VAPPTLAPAARFPRRGAFRDRAGRWPEIPSHPERWMFGVRDIVFVLLTLAVFTALVLTVKAVEKL